MQGPAPVPPPPQQSVQPLQPARKSSRAALAVLAAVGGLVLVVGGTIGFVSFRRWRARVAEEERRTERARKRDAADEKAKPAVDRAIALYTKEYEAFTTCLDRLPAKIGDVGSKLFPGGPTRIATRAPAKDVAAKLVGTFTYQFPDSNGRSIPFAASIPNTPWLAFTPNGLACK